MQGEWTLELIVKGKRYDIYWLNMSQPCDYQPFYSKLGDRDRKKVHTLINLTANKGPGRNREKWRLLEKGLFEMKADKVRALFAYHDEVRKAIIITHMYIKKQNKCPVRELERARKRRQIANNLKPA